jgi:hypothetical protein
VAANGNSPRTWFSVAMLLFGIVLGGFAGVVRGDWLGRDAAQKVEQRVEARMQERFGELKEDIQDIKQDLKELLRSRD